MPGPKGPSDDLGTTSMSAASPESRAFENPSSKRKERRRTAMKTSNINSRSPTFSEDGSCKASLQRNNTCNLAAVSENGNYEALFPNIDNRVSAMSSANGIYMACLQDIDNWISTTSSANGDHITCLQDIDTRESAAVPENGNLQALSHECRESQIKAMELTSESAAITKAREPTSESAAILEISDSEAPVQKNRESQISAMENTGQEQRSHEQAAASSRLITQHSENATHSDINRPTAISTIDFKKHLKAANWLKGGSDFQAVNLRLYFRDKEHYIPLGRFKRYRLALEPINQVMIAKEAIDDLLSFYNVVGVNSFMLLGARYEHVNEDKKTMLFAQFGNILSTESKGLPYMPPAETCWDKTGFVLALEILESGSPGEFYIMPDLTMISDEDSDDGIPDHKICDEEISDEAWRCQLCGENPPFTVARVKDQGFDLLKDTWAKSHEEEEEIRLEVLSKVRPEIVETAMARDGEDGKGRQLVGLFSIQPSKRI